MIPKVIHYCWFGKGKKSELCKKCIYTWKKKLIGYEIKEWNESNFNINCNAYVAEAYEKKRYAFVSDYVRLYVLYNYGGIYLDTDVEVLKTFDSLIKLKGFMGFENEELVAAGVIGSIKNNEFIGELLRLYNNKHFLVKGKANTVTNVRTITNLLLENGLIQNDKYQEVYKDNMIILPSDYFYPLKLGDKKPIITKNTFCIHWYEGSWLTWYQKIKINLIIEIKKIIGFKKYNYIKSLFLNNKL